MIDQEKFHEALSQGKLDEAKRLTREALERGESAETILKEGLVRAMERLMDDRERPKPCSTMTTVGGSGATFFSTRSSLHFAWQVSHDPQARRTLEGSSSR